MRWYKQISEGRVTAEQKHSAASLISAYIVNNTKNLKNKEEEADSKILNMNKTTHLYVCHIHATWSRRWLCGRCGLVHHTWTGCPYSKVDADLENKN